jgi:hypothetical protein
MERGLGPHAIDKDVGEHERSRVPVEQRDSGSRKCRERVSI